MKKAASRKTIYCSLLDRIVSDTLVRHDCYVSVLD